MPSLTASPGGGGNSLPAGQLLHVSATSVPLASGGDILTYDTLERQVGFSGNGTSGGAFLLPLSAIYVVELAFGWDAYTGGGTVELLVDGVVRRVHPDSGTGARFEWTAVIDATAGQSLSIRVTQSSGSSASATWEATVAAVEPVGESVTGISVLYGYDADAGGSSSVTIAGTSDINAGDLLVAFVHAAEPTIGSPAGFTTVDTRGTGDEKYLVQTRTAASGDAAGSWTWTAGGGSAPDESLAVMVVVVGGGGAIDGTPGHDRGSPRTSIALSTTMSNAGMLVLATTSTAAALSVPGMVRIHSASEVSNISTTRTHAIYVASVAAGAHNVTASGSSGLMAGHLVGMS